MLPADIRSGYRCPTVRSLSAKEAGFDSKRCTKTTTEHTARNMQGNRSVIHFAGLKAVRESVEKPLEYYDNNVCGTLELLAVPAISPNAGQTQV